MSIAKAEITTMMASTMTRYTREMSISAAATSALRDVIRLGHEA